MSAKFTTKIAVGKDATQKPNSSNKTTLFVNSKHRAKPNLANNNGWSSRFGKQTVKSKLTSGEKKHKRVLSKRFLRILYTGITVLFIFLFIGILGSLAYLQQLTKSLPDPEKPFDNPAFKTESSVMYDRNGVELYRLFSQDNRDILRIPNGKTLDDVLPPQVKWAFLGAEDINFYEEPGIDLLAIGRCAFRDILHKGGTCGGSTITQQVVKLASLQDNTQTLDRKIKEIILSLQLENKVHDKDKILLLYLNIVNEGGNTYGIKTAAKSLFNKDIKDLTLSEAITLAAIPNNPNVFSSKTKYGQAALQVRRNEIYNNILKYKDKINSTTAQTYQKLATANNTKLTDAQKQDFVSQSFIDSSRVEAITYNPAPTSILAPHFVFFARDMLTQGNYNNGEKFTLEEINRGGYKIYTTLDYGLQKTALDVVQNIALRPNNSYISSYGNYNAGMMVLQPSSGEILAMVGSKCYDNSELPSCSQLAKTQQGKFDPQVNLMNSQLQPGSSIKPFVYLEAYEEGKLGPSSEMADVPINISGYQPKNSDGQFRGVSWGGCTNGDLNVRCTLSNSINIPAISTLVAVGPNKLAQLKQNFGYSIYTDPTTYGPSAALGSQVVYPVEHAAAYGVLANGGNYVPYQAIQKIVDKNGTVVYQHIPQPKKVYDEKAVYMIDDTTNPHSPLTGRESPVKWANDRDMSGKTGTSENNRTNWFVNYSPDFVTLGVAVNNDNSPLGNNEAFGSTNVEPWIGEFMKRVTPLPYFNKKTPYTRPAGIVKQQICNMLTQPDGSQANVCEGNAADYLISGVMPPIYKSQQQAWVCSDQQDHLARDIDKQTGNAIQKTFVYQKDVASILQPSLDNWLQQHQGGNGAPTQQCTIQRSPNGTSPWAEIDSPKAGVTVTNNIGITIKAYSPTSTVTSVQFFLNNQQIGSTVTQLNNSTYSGNLPIPSNLYSGSYQLTVKVTDSSGNAPGVNSVNINIVGMDPGLTITAPSGSKSLASVPINVNASFSGTIGSLHLFVEAPGSSIFSDAGAMTLGSGTASLAWTPTVVGTYNLYVQSSSPVFKSPTTSVIITP